VSTATVPAFTVDGGTYTIAVTSNTKWTAGVNAAATSWCTVGPTSGEGNNPAVKVTVLENAGVDDRAATVTFTAGELTRLVAVTQTAAEPTLAVSPTEIPATNTADTYTITVTSNTAWTVSDNADWIELDTEGATGNGAVTVSALANLTFAARAATVTFTAGAITRLVTVEQEAGVPTLTVEPATISVGSAQGSTADITVISNAPWTVTVSDNADWLTVDPTSGTGDATVTVTTAQANDTGDDRTATVTFTYGDAQTQTVDVTQALATPTHAASAQTWKFGNQRWSDAIQVPECDKTDFANSTTDPHCRSYYYEAHNKTYYYYNWAYVSQNAATLCQSPWKVPTKEDAETLKNTGITPSALTDAWGFGGNANSTSVDAPIDMDALVAASMNWTSTSVNSGTNATYFGVVGWNNDTVEVNDWGSPAEHGFQVRCVK
jgi:hypothetical protein